MDRRFFVLFVSLMVIVNIETSFATEKMTGLIINEKDAFQGYTMFSPKSCVNTFLINMKGEVVHTWESKYGPGQSVYLLDNGLLFRPAVLRNLEVSMGTASGGFEVMDWEGNVVWFFEYHSKEYLPHHDMEPLPNGNILVLAWEFKTEQEALAYGRDPRLLRNKALWPEKIVEVQQTGPDKGKIVWEWRLWDHIIQDVDANKPNYGIVKDHPELLDINSGTGKADWLHTNAIDYNPFLDQIVLSARQLNELIILDHSTTTEEAKTHTGGKYGMGGDILYRWGNPLNYDSGSKADMLIEGQHDTRWIEPGLIGAGNIICFSNGAKRGYSSVEEFTPPMDENGNYSKPKPGKGYGPEKVSWSYSAPNKTDFYSQAVSGAQRLPNGNTLICSGTPGIFFEVTYDGEIVWKYINPVVRGGNIVDMYVDPKNNNGVFRCTRIPLDHNALTDKRLVSKGTLHEIYSDKIITEIKARVRKGKR